MIKRYKDGKFIDVSKEESQKIHNRAEKNRKEMQQRKASRPSIIDHEARIKALEDAMNKLLANEEVKEVVEETKEESEA